MKHMKKICLITSAAILGCALLTGCGSNATEPTAESTQPSVAVIVPSQYTWEEYQALTDAQKEAFRLSFSSEAAFERWAEEAEEDYIAGIEMPWENGGKQPVDYTWEEFEALNAHQQMAFQTSFGDFEAFDNWLMANMPQETDPASALPWENGGKAPADYTWEEFEDLSAELQMAFQNSFGSFEEFDKWLGQNMPQEGGPVSNLPWETGGKAPADYSWDEFESLSAELQIAFQNSFGSLEDFDRWLQKAQSGGSDLPWDNGGKRPEDYTWAEFEALSPEHQIIFQSSFAEEDGFETWLMANMPQ